MMRLPWLWKYTSLGVSRLLRDQDGHVRALLERAGDDYYCEVWPNLHDPSVQTTVNRFPSAVMTEAENLLLGAGVEL